MADLPSFHFFPDLPPELRLKIWHYAMPSRILQLGIDFPFPFLPDPAQCDDEGIYKPIFAPTPSYTPALFSVNHESRQLCLKYYIPFAYAYVHPSLDTLYMAVKSYSQLIHQRERSCSATIAAPLYPLAYLEKLVVELDVDDFNGPTPGVEPLYYFRKVQRITDLYGVPKKLLLVPGNRRTVRGLSKVLYGYDGLEILEEPPEKQISSSASDILSSVKRVLEEENPADYPWYDYRQPEISFVHVKSNRVFNRHITKEWMLKTREARERITLEWQDEDQVIGPIHKRPMGPSWPRDSLERTERALEKERMRIRQCKYSPVSTENALARYKEKIKQISV